MVDSSKRNCEKTLNAKTVELANREHKMTKTVQRFNLNEIAAFRITCKCEAVYEIAATRIALPLGENNACVHCGQRLFERREENVFAQLANFLNAIENEDRFTVEAEIPPPED